MKKKIVMVLLAGTLAVSLLGGCGKKSSSSKSSDTSDVSVMAVKEDSEKEYKTIGEKTEGAYEVKLTNTTGQKITGVSIKSSLDKKYSDNMLKEKDEFEKDETRILYYKPSEEAEKGTGTESGKELPTEYTVQITLADKTVVELHAFPFEDMEEGKIALKDGVGYLTYEKDGSEVSTLDAELAVKAQKEQDEKSKADAEAAAEAAAAAQAEAATETQSNSDTTSDTTSQSDTSQAYEAPATETPATETPTVETPATNAGNTEDGCVGDGLTY